MEVRGCRLGEVPGLQGYEAGEPSGVTVGEAGPRPILRVYSTAQHNCKQNITALMMRLLFADDPGEDGGHVHVSEHESLLRLQRSAESRPWAHRLQGAARSHVHHRTSKISGHTYNTRSHSSKNTKH